MSRYLEYFINICLNRKFIRQIPKNTLRRVLPDEEKLEFVRTSVLMIEAYLLILAFPTRSSTDIVRLG